MTHRTSLVQIVALSFTVGGCELIYDFEKEPHASGATGGAAAGTAGASNSIVAGATGLPSGIGGGSHGTGTAGATGNPTDTLARGGSGSVAGGDGGGVDTAGGATASPNAGGSSGIGNGTEARSGASNGGAVNGSTASGGAATSIGGTSTLNGGASSGGAGTGVAASAGTASSLGGSASGGASVAIGGNGSGGGPAQGGSVAAGGSGAVAGNASTGGTSSPVTIVITPPTIGSAQTRVPYTATVTASGASSYSWSVSSGALPPGITLQSTDTATVTLAGTTTAAGLYPFTLSVTDGTAKQTIDLSLGVTHRVAFLVDRTGGTVPELYLSNAGKEVAGSPVKVNEFLGGDSVTSFKWSPDGSYIAYTTSRNNGGQLYVTRATNPGTATSVESAAAAYVWLNSGQTLAVATRPGTLDLVDVAGATLTRQSAPLPAVASGEQRGIDGLVASPVGRAVSAFYSDWQPPGSRTVLASYYVNWPEGGSATAGKLFASSDPAADVSPAAFSSDGTLAIVQPGFGFGFTTYDLTNPAAPAVVGGSPGGLEPRWSPTARDLMTTAPQSGIYFARFANGAWLGTQVVPGVSTLFVEWSPNGNHILLKVDHDLRTLANVATASPNTDVSLLPDGFLINGFTDVTRASWSPDSAWVAFRANQTTSALYEMYLVRWPGPGPSIPVSAMNAAPGVGVWQFAPNSSAIAYLGTTYSAATSSLHLVTLPTTGAAPSAVALTGASDPTVRDDVAWLPGSRVLLYRAADAGGDQVHGIHVNANGIASAPFSVSGATTSGRGVTAYAIAP